MKKLCCSALCFCLASLLSLAGEVSVLSAHIETPCRAVVEPVELCLWLQLPPQHVVVELRPTQLSQRFSSPEGVEDYGHVFQLSHFPGYVCGLPEGKCKVNLACVSPCERHEWSAVEGSLELTYAQLGAPVEFCISMEEPSTLELHGRQIHCRPLPENGEVELRCNMRLVALDARDEEGDIDLGLDEEEDEDDDEEEGEAEAEGDRRYTLAVCTESRRLWVRLCALHEPITESVPYRAQRVRPESCRLLDMPSDAWMERECDRVCLWAYIALPDHIAALEFCGMETSFTFNREDGKQMELSPIACAEVGGLTYPRSIHCSTLTFHLPEDWNEAHIKGELHYMLREMEEYSEARKISLCAPADVKLGERTVHVLPTRLKNGATRVRLSSEVPLAASETQFMIEGEQQARFCRYIISSNAKEGACYIYEYDLCTDAAEITLRLRPIRAPHLIRIPIHRNLKQIQTHPAPNFTTTFCTTHAPLK